MIGIDSAKCNLEDRENVWNHFATDWKLNELKRMCNTVDLDGVIPEIKKILKGEQTGRVLLQL